jgi:lipoprotein-releasing system ATP-binding protein
MKKIILESRHLFKSFPSPHTEVLRDCNLEIKEGETVCIMGKSGEGKSTLLHILGLLEPPTSGNLFFEGNPIDIFTHAFLRAQKIGFISQFFYLFEEFSVLDNLLLPLRIQKKRVDSNSEAYKQAFYFLQEIQLEHRFSVLAKHLSGGEKQRVAIARVLLLNSSIILADEPSGNLDFKTSQVIYDLLFKLCSTHGKTLIIATHDPNISPRCSRTLILKEGKLQCNLP